MLASLANLGPKSQQMLQEAGICHVDQLRQLGAVAAFVAVRQVQSNVSLNLLWALEGALTDQPWQNVARKERLRLLLELEAASGKPVEADPNL